MKRMKQLARNYVYCPGMDKEVEDFVQNCEPCQQAAPVKNASEDAFALLAESNTCMAKNPH